MGATLFHHLSFINLKFIIKTIDKDMEIVPIMSKMLLTRDLNIDNGNIRALT